MLRVVDKKKYTRLGSTIGGCRAGESREESHVTASAFSEVVHRARTILPTRAAEFAYSVACRRTHAGVAV